MSLAPVGLLGAAVLALAVYAYAQRKGRILLAREGRIRSYAFPAAVFTEFGKAYPQLDAKQTQLVARALREYFLVHARSRKTVVAMPSKVVDALWHAFILDTRAYKSFCQAAFGAYFHHIPESAMAELGQSNAAGWHTWRLACLEENINPNKATRMPLLFAIDAKLAIPGATLYTPDMFKKPRASSSSDGGGGCGGGSDSNCDSGDGGGGDGGDGGCGGGCGGD
jgi:hypothetical protein